MSCSLTSPRTPSCSLTFSQTLSSGLTVSWTCGGNYGSLLSFQTPLHSQQAEVGHGNGVSHMSGGGDKDVQSQEKRKERGVYVCPVVLCHCGLVYPENMVVISYYRLTRINL